MSHFFDLFYRSFGAYKGSIIFLALLGFGSGLLSGIGINALIPLLSLVMGESGKGTDIVSRSIEQLFALLHVDFTVQYLLFFIVFVFVTKAAILLLFTYINSRITSDFEEIKRNTLFSTTMRADWPHLLRGRSGHLEVLLMQHVSYGKSLMVLVGSGFLIMANLIVYTFVALNVSAYITMMTFLLGGLFFFLIFKPVASRVRSIASEDEILRRDIAHYVSESMTGMKTIKAMSVAEAIVAVGRTYFQRIKNLHIKSTLAGTLGGILLEPASLIFLSVMFGISYRVPGFHLASFLVVMYASKQIFLYIEQFQALVLSAHGVLPYVEHLLQYEHEAAIHEELDRGTNPFSMKREIAFQHVHFAYHGGNSVLSDVSFSVPKGAMIGIIGPSGAGKTTVVDLLLRLFAPTSGRIVLDGMDISHIKLGDWRKAIGYVSQDFFLMNDTIANNIRFYDSSIDDAAVRDAATQANILDFIETLPQGFQTVVGERGVMLSGGQRQRLVIARALARKPEILILDEATSALDNESELTIQRAIAALKGRITTLVIAHRLSTIMQADRLIALNNGGVVEDGTPQDLLNNPQSYFYAMYHMKH